MNIQRSAVILSTALMVLAYTVTKTMDFEVIENKNFDPSIYSISYTQDKGDLILHKGSLEMAGISKFVIDGKSSNLSLLNQLKSILKYNLEELGIPKSSVCELLIDAKTICKTCVAIKKDFSSDSGYDIALATQDNNDHYSLRVYKFNHNKIIKIKHLYHQLSVKSCEWYNEDKLLLWIKDCIVLVDPFTGYTINPKDHITISLPSAFKKNNSYNIKGMLLHPFKRHTLLCFLTDGIQERMYVGECNLLSKRYKITSTTITDEEVLCGMGSGFFDFFNFYVKFLKENYQYTVHIATRPEYANHFVRKEIRLPLEVMDTALKHIRSIKDDKEREAKEKNFIEEYLSAPINTKQ